MFRKSNIAWVSSKSSLFFPRSSAARLIGSTLSKELRTLIEWQKKRETARNYGCFFHRWKMYKERNRVEFGAKTLKDNQWEWTIMSGRLRWRWDKKTTWCNDRKKGKKRKWLGAAEFPIGWRTAGRELDNRLLQSLALSPVVRGSQQRWTNWTSRNPASSAGQYNGNP